MEDTDLQIYKRGSLWTTVPLLHYFKGLCLEECMRGADFHGLVSQLCTSKQVWPLNPQTLTLELKSSVDINVRSLMEYKS